MNRRALLQMMGAAAAMPFVTEPAAHAAGNGDGIYELRTYTCFPGKQAALLQRFKQFETALFAKAGMTGVGYWVPEDEPGKSNKLVYLLRHRSREAAKESWARFQKDPEWLKVKGESEKDGPLVDIHDIVFMDLTDFSPKV